MPVPSELLRDRALQRRGGDEISLSEVLAALSLALDLTEGQPAGHTVRACLIGMRIGDALGLDAAERSALRYALLLKDAGCSGHAARLRAHRGASVREVVRVRSERGAGIALALGFPEATAEAIRSLDERWDGQGHPMGRAGDEIPLLARIASLAQVLEVFHRTRGVDGALGVAEERRGRWFDPALVDLVHGWRHDHAWWSALGAADSTDHVIAAADESARCVDDAALDDVAHAFAEIIDAKSPFTFRHSTNVAEYAVGIARVLGRAPAELRRLRRASLLHDIGKLGVSNRILDKPGMLTAGERLAIEQHPRYTWDILSRVRAFHDFALTAALHHERLDGSGYPWGVDGSALDVSARVLAVADIYEALTAHRPYRAGMPPEQALALLRKDAGTRLYADAVAALERYVAEREHPVPHAVDLTVPAPRPIVTAAVAQYPAPPVHERSAVAGE